MDKWAVLFLVLLAGTVQATPNLYSLDLNYLDSSGQIVGADSNRGSYILLDAMATWCGPCRIEMLHLQEVYDVIKDVSDIRILTMSMDPVTDSLASVAEFMEEFEADWDYALDYQTSLLEALNVTGYPTTFLIDPDGNVLQKWLGLIEANEILTELDNYLDLPGSWARQLGLSPLVQSLVLSPFFIVFMVGLFSLMIRGFWQFAKRVDQ